jgi:hypothetical protein
MFFFCKWRKIAFLSVFILETSIYMIHTKNSLLLLITIGILTSCGPTLKVSSDYDRSVDFSQYKTFTLFKSDHSTINPLNAQRITNSIMAEMEKKGFRNVSTDPDLLVNTVALVKDKESVSSTTNYGYGGVYRPYYWGTGMSSSYTSYDVQHYKEGSLIIDIVEAKNKKLLWQGVGNSKIDGPMTDADTRIPEAVTKIMEGFPPGKTTKQ